LWNFWKKQPCESLYRDDVECYKENQTKDAFDDG